MARMRPLFSDLIDRELGIATRVGYDPDTDTLGIERIQDFDPILDANRRDMNSGLDGYTSSRDLQRVASIPLIVVEKWLKAGIDVFNEDDWPKVAAMLDSPDYAYLRTAPGRLARRPQRQVFTGVGSHRSAAEQAQVVERGIREGTSF